MPIDFNAKSAAGRAFFNPPGVNRLGNGLFLPTFGFFAGVSGAVEQLILGMKLPGSALNYSDSQDWGAYGFSLCNSV